MAPSHLHAQTHTGTTCRKRSPQGVQSNFISPHMQDEDGHPQSSSTLLAAHRKVTVTRGFNHTGTLAIPSQGWLHSIHHHRVCTKKATITQGYNYSRGQGLMDRVSFNKKKNVLSHTGHGR